MSFDDFDIWCINLKHRTDRRKKMEQIFDKLNILDRVKFYTTILDSRGGRIGCFQSHYNCLTNSTRPYIIVFEDDCELNVEDLNWNNILEDIKLYLQWCDYFSIACVPIYESTILRENPLKIILGSFTTALCYAIKHSTVKQIQPDLSSHLETNHIDFFYWENLYSCGYSTPLFKQSFESSDNPWINNSRLDWLLRKFVSGYYKTQGLLFSPQQLCRYYYNILYTYQSVFDSISYIKDKFV
jgi:hypothetical protein